MFDSCRTAEKISDYLLENYRELEHSRNVENVRSETVAEETGISRQVLTGFLINQITMPMVCRILEYLEDKTVEDYERTVERCSCRMKDVEEKRKTAWGDYLFREKNIAGLRKMYLLKRSQPLVPQKSGKEICSVL